MKVLVTGSTATHCSKKVNTRVPTFTGQLVSTLENLGHEVSWEEPRLGMDTSYLNSFDSIVVGMAPLTSVSSRWLYGSLSVLDYATKLNKAVIFVDAPEPQKVWSGIRAIANKPEDLTKPFYSAKKEYVAACEPKTRQRIISLIDRLYGDIWPSTIYPALPWDDRKIMSNIPNLDTQNTHSFNFDRSLLELDINKTGPENADFWCVDSPKTKWSKQVSKTLTHEILPIRDNYWQGNRDALSRMDSSIGTLISTYKDSDVWWSVMLSQSLFVGTPVVTDWRKSGVLGEEWRFLASSVEAMSPSERHSLALLQKDSYLASIPTHEEIKNSLESSIFT